MFLRKLSLKFENVLLIYINKMLDYKNATICILCLLSSDWSHVFLMVNFDWSLLSSIYLIICSCLYTANVSIRMSKKKLFLKENLA